MIKIANAPCSWGVLEFELEGEKLGYTQVLDEMKETGYEGTELGDWDFMPTDPQRLKDELDQRGLNLLGAFVPAGMSNAYNHSAGEKCALKTAELMFNAGFADAFIVLADDNGQVPIRTQNAGRITSAQGLTEEKWTVFADGAMRIAQSVKNRFGMRTVFHHHCGGYVETPEEIDTLLKLTDPGLIGLCLDTGHYLFGGGDPLAALKKYSDRIWHVHFKDCEPHVAAASREQGWDYFKSVEKGVFCELGKGQVNFDAVVTELKSQGYKDWIVVEQDVLPGMGAPKECAQRNRNYLKKIGL